MRYKNHYFWSDASGNQEAFNECYSFLISPASSLGESVNNGARPISVQAANQAVIEKRVPEVMIVLGDPGCGATGLGDHLAIQLRTAGRKVLVMDRISALEPGNFKANLDAALQIPPDAGNTPGAFSAGLSALQIAVLEARNYECFIVHDAYIYDSGGAARHDNAMLIIQLLRLTRIGRFVILGVRNLMEWLLVSLSEAFVQYRMVRLDPMSPGFKFGQFITDVALRVLPPCLPGRIESIDMDALYMQSRGKVGCAVTTLLHQLTEQVLPTVNGDVQPATMWTCDDEEISINHMRNESSLATQKNRKATNQAGDTDARTALETEGQAACESSGCLRVNSAKEAGSETLLLTPCGPARPEADSRLRLPAVDNEAFSSWIARQTMGPSHSIAHRLGDYLVLHCSKGGADPDMQWGNLEILGSLSPVDRRYVCSQFSPSGRDSTFFTLRGAKSDSLTTVGSLSNPALIPYSKARNYCPECFKAVLAAGSAPALRLDWRRPRLGICMRHRAPVLLEQLATSSFSILDKAWRAFAEYAGSPASRLTTQFPMQHSSSTQAKTDSERLAALAGRVQTWFFSLTPETSPSARAAELLMSYWLQDLNPSGSQGFARSYFFHNYAKPKMATKKQHGDISGALKPDSARPRDLAVAYWMIGIGFGVIDSAEAQFIRDSTRPYSLPFRATRREICSVGGLAYSRAQRHAYLVFSRTALSDSEYKSVAWAIEYEGQPYRGPYKSHKKIKTRR